MLRKITAIFLVVSLLAGLTGCEALRRKFVRRKKAKPIRPVFYREGEGEEPRPPAELYIIHYVYWKTWMDDLINNAGKNKKRDRRACSEAIANLADMKKYLVKKKAEELDKYIDELGKIAERVKTGHLHVATLGKVKQDLDKIKMRIAKKFYYKKVKDYIKKD